MSVEATASVPTPTPSTFADPMSTRGGDPAGSEAERMPLERRLAVAAVAVGTFSVVTAEQLPVGLLTSVGGDLGVSEGTAGLMATVPGLVASATAPILPVLIGRLDRRIVLLGLVTLMVVANILSATAPNFAVLIVSRFLVGISIGGFWSLAAGLAVRMVPERYVPRATAIAFGGATAANVLGVPAGTLIGGLTDWRIAFVAWAAWACWSWSRCSCCCRRCPPPRRCDCARWASSSATRSSGPASWPHSCW
jgi:predicted MFS family arabinose efflux permease